jgi:hypothetical protein
MQYQFAPNRSEWKYLGDVDAADFGQFRARFGSSV